MTRAWFAAVAAMTVAVSVGCGGGGGGGDVTFAALGQACETDVQCQSAHCQNGVCCAPGGTCCATAAVCTGSLGCDAATSACFTTCTDTTSTQCADPAAQFCSQNACVQKLDAGATCYGDFWCKSGRCISTIETRCTPVGCVSYPAMKCGS